MRTSKISRGFILSLVGIAFCFVLKAQTNSAAPASPAATTAPADTGGTGQTVVNPNETVFPHSAKNPPSEVVAAESNAPLLWNGFETHVAFELGGRTLAKTGNSDVYLTFVDIKPGFRLLDNSLELHSVAHNGQLFDDFSESAFGLGGDPNEVVRVRARKHNWYDFNGTWRRDLNFWDYNLLGNPLNPLTNKPIAVPINVSPDLLDLSRKMLDVNLVIRPEARLQFQLGFSHYNNGGYSTTTIHESTDGLLSQPWHDDSDTFRFGVAWRPVERTRISYDQFYTHIKSDTSTLMTSFPYSLSNGTGVNLGVSWNNTPCASPFVGAYVNPTCSLFTGYSDVTSYYTDVPTEQLSFQTSYFRKLHLTGRGSYTGAETQMPGMVETYNGYGSNRLQSTTTGHATIQQITTSVDGGATYELTERMSLDDQFRWYDYRIPAAASFVQAYLFGTNALSTPITFSTSTCPPPYTSVTGCPTHTTSSSADQTATSYSMFQGQNQKRNTLELHYQFATHLSAYAGYRFERQDIVLDGDTASIASYFPLLPNRGSCAGKPVVNGVCQVSSSSVSTAGVQINSHTGLIGIAAEPIHGLRLHADAELTYADNVFTNIQARHMQLYRGKAIYSPKKWVDLSATARIQEMKDLDANLGNLQHNRSFTFGAVFPFSARWGLDFSYSYNNLLTNMNICFAETPVPSFGAPSAFCPTGYLTALDYYRNVDHFGTANIMFKPIPRATFTAGYTLTSTNGATLLLDPLAPLGPVAINYHLPTASVAFTVAKHVTFKGGWNLFDYIEKSAPGPVAPRNFEANVLSVSLRYAM